jgi:hypothetical protein
MDEIIKILDKLRACEDALEWLKGLPEGTTPQAAWEACERGDWMLWLLVRMHPNDSEYHRFIIRSAQRALLIAGSAVVPSLFEALADKRAWYRGATVKELEEPVVWKEDLVWMAAWALVWDRLCRERSPQWDLEKKLWAEDLRELFERPEVKAKKKK